MNTIKTYKFCFDLDGTICHTKQLNQKYIDVLPIKGAVETLQQLKSNGHYIIIYTARNMLTYNNNIGKIIANQSRVVINWLETHNIPFDELHFGKPLADFYIDDKGVKFSNWDEINNII